MLAWALYRASVASFAGRHQDSFSIYQSMVAFRPSAKSVCAGLQPSSRCSLVLSMAYRQSWPGRSATQSKSSESLPMASRIMRRTVMLFFSPSAPMR